MLKLKDKSKEKEFAFAKYRDSHADDVSVKPGKNSERWDQLINLWFNQASKNLAKTSLKRKTIFNLSNEYRLASRRYGRYAIKTLVASDNGKEQRRREHENCLSSLFTQNKRF